MSEKGRASTNSKPRKSSRMPENSALFEKVVPTLLVVMAVVTVGLILFALGVLVGLVSF
jgi:hypothetical protein